MVLPTKTMAPIRATKAGSSAAMGLCALTCALMLAAGPASGTTYKWTDANGRVVYSDQPPPGNVGVESIAPPPPPANPNAVKELASQQAALQQKRQLRAEEEAKGAKTRADADKKREQCAKVRGQITAMQAQPNLYQTNAKGEQVFMDDSAKRKERDQLNGWIKENCAS